MYYSLYRFQGAHRSFLHLRRSASVRYFSVITLSDATSVDKFAKINQKSVLYFTAAWCGPCKMIKPLYEEIAQANPNIAFGKVDVDENEDAAIDFEISSVPTFVFFDGNQAVQRFSGADPTKLKQVVQELAAR